MIENPYQEALKSMLKEFADIPITDNDEIEEPFMHFEAGSDRFEVLKWFDERLEHGTVKTINEHKKELSQKKICANKKKSFKEIRNELNNLYDQIEQTKKRIKELTKECVDRFAVLDPGHEIYSNSPFQSKDRLYYKIRIKNVKLNRTRDGRWFWTATGSYVKNDGSEGSLTKSFSTTKFQ